jgi:DNA-binding response OmpR family regulator
MPVKGGWDTFERLTTINPLLPIIIITARPDAYPIAVVAGAALMQKPLDLPRLLKTMRELLAQPAEQRLSLLAKSFFQVKEQGFSNANAALER